MGGVVPAPWGDLQVCFLQINEACLANQRARPVLLPGFVRLAAGPHPPSAYAPRHCRQHNWGRSKFGQKLRNGDVRIEDKHHKFNCFSPLTNLSSTAIVILILTNACAVFAYILLPRLNFPFSASPCAVSSFGGLTNLVAFVGLCPYR